LSHNKKETLSAGRNRGVARVCTICSAAQRQAIEAELVTGCAVSAIARKFAVSRDSLTRHKAKCVREVVEKQMENLATSLVEELSGLHAITRNLLESARQAEDTRTALAAVRESRENLTLLARLTGQFDQVRDGKPQLTWEEFEAIYDKAAK
jgi:hypothetical protein